MHEYTTNLLNFTLEIGQAMYTLIHAWHIFLKKYNVPDVGQLLMSLALN